jgi:Protein of unknown function (DUF669)
MALPVDMDAPAAALARLDDEWTRTSVSSDELYADIPDGTYNTVIEEARLTETVSTGRPMVVWKLRIQGPQAANRVVTKSRVVTENTLVYLKEELEKCGLQVSRLSELPARLRELVNHPISVQKSTKDGRVNFYFRWDSNRSGKSFTGDDIPF